MYGMNESLNNQYSNSRMMIYEPWLQKLGLSMPQTIDEFLNVLRAFRDRDPNGNGQKDEIPLISYRDMMGTNYLYTLMMPFIYTQPDFWILNNGKIDVAFNKPGWRDGIRYSKQLIDEGLLSPLSFTQDMTQMTALISPEPTKVGGFVRYSASNLGATDKKRSEYTIVPPLQGPAGKQSLWWPILPGIRMLITKNCKNPESAFMMGDFMATEEMSVNNHYGEKGVDWTDPPAGSKGYVAGYEPLALPKLQWGTLQNKHWAENGPNLRGKKWAFPDIATDSPYDYVIPIGKGLPDAIKYGMKNPIVGLIYNDQEQEVINELHATILTYARESFARFATGDISIDRDWDKYVAEFDKMGLQDVIKVTQSAWDRMNK
jgi:putative aldouronate transport system substrate-binding protein